MAKTGTVKHTHQYFKRPDGLWACNGRGVGCTHYMPSNMHPLPLGRNSICFSCEREFQLLPSNMKQDKPVCDNCEERADDLEKFIEEKTRLAMNTQREESDPLAIYNKVMKKVSQPVNERHAPDCDSYMGEPCSCKVT